MKAFALTLACLWAASISCGAYGGDRFQEPPELARLKNGDIKDLVAVLAGPDKILRVPDQTRAQSHKVSLRAAAVAAVQKRLDEARPLLIPLLDNAETRATALAVLVAEDLRNIKDLEPRLIGFLSEEDAATRTASARILGKFKDEAARDGLIAALSKAEARPEPERFMEIIWIVKSLAENPLVSEKAVVAVARVIDTRAGHMLWSIVDASVPLSQSKEWGGRLLERYWRVGAVNNLSEYDERTLPYFRKLGELADTEKRAAAATKLFGHVNFDPQREKELSAKVLGDAEPFVRRQAIYALCQRRNLDRKYVITKALKLAADDPDKSVKQFAMTGVFDAIGEIGIFDANGIVLPTPVDGKTPFMRDKEFALPEKMIKAMDDPTLRAVIVYGTHRLLQNWKPDPAVKADDVANEERVREWWAKWQK